MTEKEKAAKGLLYNANYDKEIISDREKAKEILYHYNHLHPSKTEERQQIIRGLLKSAGKEFIIEPPFYCDYGYNIEIGENFFSNMNLVILDGAMVTIGSNVFIAPNVGIYTAGHPFDVQQRNEGLEYAYPVTIGDNVWIGAGVNILPGVNIGSNTVIGAGSVVSKDIPEGVLAVGNPCRVIRKITDEDKGKYKMA
ncbi:sugar O-acetyltransferase [Prevotella sp. 10(H)]|uniref:sugar O-acetyltransferase n=1 Tax=Prevotella sp. 10(H) TaxID=1158294 RepID=UPI0004A711D4|nr:sugar O-acetyltransferase [Prevotella sp. 10(H)]